MIYLDSAATSLQKPPEVWRAVRRAMEGAASPGRGGHPWGREAARLVYSCRERAAELFHVPGPEQVVFTCNATHALNIAIRSLVRPGATVLISGYEHNAVTRPLHAVEGVQVRVARAPVFDREGMLRAFREELDRGVDAAVCTHVSNVFGFILPLEEIAGLCRARDVPLIVDAAQSAGCVPIDFTALGAQFVAMPGHKGLYGPQGTGILLCAGEAQPLLYGGTGSLSVRQTMPDFLPDRLEAGTPNVPGIAGLEQGLRFVARMGVGNIAQYERRLVRTLGALLRETAGVDCFLAEDEAAQGGVLAFRVNGTDCENTGECLGEQGVAVRAGLHCAPLAHESAGTLETGVVRASVSRFNTVEEIRTAAGLIRRLAGRT